MKNKKALTLVLLIVTSMLLLPLYIPISSAQGTGAYPSDPDFINLGMFPATYPPAYPDVSDLGGMWMELYPGLNNKYVLTYWIDTDGDNIVNASDQIALYSPVGRASKWYHVEWVTATLKLTNTTADPVFKGKPLFLEFNGTIGQFNLIINAPIGTKWHMVFPKWSLSLNISGWTDDGDGQLDPSDSVTLLGLPATYHVDEVNTNMIVSEEPAYPEDPDFIHLDLEPPDLVNASLGSKWHELYPEYCNTYTINYWVDTDGSGIIDQCDQVMLNDTWYHVEWVTVTMKLENATGTENMTIEFGGPLDKFMAGPVGYPVNTWWHEVYPKFSRWYTIIDWTDEGDGVLGYCDNVTVVYGPMDRSEDITEWHVEALKTDLIVSLEPQYPEDPSLMHLDMLPHGDYPPEEPYLGSIWHELYPEYCNTYTIYNWIDDNNNSVIDVCDLIKLEDVDLEKKWYHVEWVTVTMVLNETTSHEIIYVEFGGTWDKFMSGPWFKPFGTWWHEVWPLFSNWYNLTSWTDDGDGVLDYCDIVDFEELPGFYWHVDALKTDLIVSPVKPPTYVEVIPSANIVWPVCTNFTVDINVVDAPETYAWSVQLSWNKSVLEVVDDGVKEGDFLKRVGHTTNFIPPISIGAANAAGNMTVSCTFLGTVSPGAAGDGTLFNVTFHVKDVGFSWINLTDTGLRDMALVSTDYPNKDGFFVETTQTVHDVAITDLTVLPHQLQQGDPVYINVTVHDEGDFPQTVNVTIYADLECHVWNSTDPDKLLRGDEIIIAKYSSIPLAPCIPELIPAIWDTLLVPGEQYVIWAEVVKTDGEEDDDPHDNIFIDGGVHVVSGNDLKVVDVTVLTPEDLSTFGPYVDKASYKSNPRITAEEHTVKINVTVLNEGKLPETFNVTVYAWNSTWSMIVGWKVVVALNSPVQGGRTSIVVGFIWNVNATVLPSPGWYNITAEAWQIPAITEEPKNWDDNVFDLTDVPGVVCVAHHDISIDSLTVFTNHPEGNYPVRRIGVNATNVGTVPMKFNIVVFADPDFSFPILDGDEIFCGSLSAYLTDGDTLSTTGIAVPDGTPGWNLTGSITLTDILLGIVPEPKDRFVVPDGTYLLVASLKADVRYPDKNMLNDYAIAVDSIAHPDHDVGVTSVNPANRYVPPGENFNVSVTVENQGIYNSEDVNITVYADGNLVGFKVSLGIPANSTGKLNVTEIVTCTSVGLVLNNWYTISANATILLGVVDGDPIDNGRTDLNIQIRDFDIMITSMTSNLNQTYLDTAYPSWNPGVLEFYVTVLNNDTVSHTFSIALYYDDDGTLTLIEQTNLFTLAGKTSKMETFEWDIPSIPKAVPYPTYDITAKIMITDSNPDNNELSNRTVTIRWTGDATPAGMPAGDGYVNLSDLSLLADHWFGHLIPARGYDPRVDFNMDSKIDLSDLSLLADNWFKGPLQ